MEDLLIMSSGLECINEPEVGELTLEQMRGSPDWVQFTLDLPMAETPGTHWVYCSPGPHLLSAIIQESTGKSALAFAQENLFGPLGISDAIWPADPQGNNNGWGDLMMTPLDMAKLGYLYLRQGEWDGQQLLHPNYVSRATSPVINLPPEFPKVGGYGYLWWLNGSDSYYADGRDGQRIFVYPDLDMVVVTTGGGGPDQYGALETMLTSYILPAAESETPLPPNPDGVALLESRVQQVAASPQAEPVPPLPEIAQEVSGQTYVMDDNPAGLLSGSLTFETEAEALLTLSFIGGNQAEWLVGLDDVFRFSPGLNGQPSAAKGGWESDNVFVIHRDEVGSMNQEQINVTFEEDQVTLQVAGLTLVGRLEE